MKAKMRLRRYLHFILFHELRRTVGENCDTREICDWLSAFDVLRLLKSLRTCVSHAVSTRRDAVRKVIGKPPLAHVQAEIVEIVFTNNCIHDWLFETFLSIRFVLENEIEE